MLAQGQSFPAKKRKWAKDRSTTEDFLKGLFNALNLWHVKTGYLKRHHCRGEEQKL